MKVLASQVCWRLALQLGTSPASDVALLNQAATVAVRAERWQEALALLSNGDTDGVAALGVALDAAQKGLAWQLALQALGTRLEAGSNVVSWNAACGACVGHWEVVLNLLEEMVTRNMSPDVVSYTVAVTACAQQLRWQQILVLLEKSGGGDPVTIWHAWRSHEVMEVEGSSFKLERMDRIVCGVVTPEGRHSRYMILHKYLLLLVQPDVVQPGWAVVKTLLPVRRVEPHLEADPRLLGLRWTEDGESFLLTLTFEERRNRTNDR
eukprot:g23243.t1